MNKSKTMILSPLLIIVSVLTSCSKDDDPTIVGNWEAVSTITENFTNDVSDGTDTFIIDDNNFEKLTFNSDNTFNYDYSELDIIVDGEEKFYTESSSGSYTTEDNSLTLTYEDGDYDEEIQIFTYSLENNQLKLISSDEYTSNGDVIKSIITTTLNRQ